MKDKCAKGFTSIDPIDVQEINKGESYRKQVRIKIIKNFLSWAYWKESGRWTDANYDEKVTVTRHISQAKLLAGFGLFMNGLFYAAFLQGIYNYRTREVINMRLVPTPIKLTVSTVVSSYIAYNIWKDDIYDPDLYKLSIKYRPEFD